MSRPGAGVGPEPGTGPAAGRDPTAGQAVYTPFTLRLYDLVVHGLSNPLAWGCPTSRLHAHVAAHAAPADHLEVGPGSGFLLRRRVPAGGWPGLTLLDLNPHCLAYAARRLGSSGPPVESVRADVLRPLTLPRRYRSVGLMYVLHCLPGTMAEKAVALDHLAAWLAPDGVLYGATLLADQPLGAAGRRLMAVYNRRGVFTNHGDTLPALRAALEARFPVTRIDVNGAVALFSARVTSPPAG